MAQYIDKDKVVAEIKRRKQTWQHQDQQYSNGGKDVCDYLLGFLDTLEVKEVDLDSDIRTYLTNHFNIYEDGVLQSKKSGLPLSTYDIIKVAEHFFELGLKAKYSAKQRKNK